MRSRWPFALAATSCAPLVLRAAVLSDQAGRLAGVDALGFVSDLAAALLAAALLVRLGRIGATLFTLVWTIAHYANFELVRELGAPASLRDAHYLFDATFAAGSALAISSPWLLGGLAVAGCGLAAAGARAARRSSGALAGAGLALALLVTALPGAPEQPGWRQADFLQRDVSLAIRSLFEPPSEQGETPDPPVAMLERWPALAADLDGATRLVGTARAPNVLLVVLESLSGIHLESFAREHGRRADAALPRLDALAERSLRYVTFVTHQRKTNRGLYALLCGELPNLGSGTPKMSAAAESPWRVCLPDVLREAGYRTAYLQAAPLAFMMKDRFMPRAGFEAVDGHDWFEHAYTKSAWGVDDRALFEEADRRIAELRRGEGPWLLTLLSVGTHHPYLVPEAFQPGRPRSFRRAAAYLDEAFGAFVERLDAGGLLEDTLLVVTSDESFGFAGFRTEPSFKQLSQNWGILLVRGPGVPTGIVKEPYAQIDLALSIADYLGLSERAGHFFGRSVFRRYATPREVFFANVNLGSLGAIEPAGSLLLCGSTDECRRYPVSDGRFFGVLPEATPAGQGDAGVALLRDVARRSAPTGGNRPRSYELLARPEIRLDDDQPHMLHGGQFVQLEAGEWLEVEYEVTLSGDAAAEVEVVHRLTARHNESLLRRRVKLASGQRLTLRYRYVPDGEQGEIQCRTTVKRLAGADVLLRHGRARMRVREGPERPPPGAQLEAFEVAPG